MKPYPVNLTEKLKMETELTSKLNEKEKSINQSRKIICLPTFTWKYSTIRIKVVNKNLPQQNIHFSAYLILLLTTNLLKNGNKCYLHKNMR